jgi:hypothetical protein
MNLSIFNPASFWGRTWILWAFRLVTLNLTSPKSPQSIPSPPPADPHIHPTISASGSVIFSPVWNPAWPSPFPSHSEKFRQTKIGRKSPPESWQTAHALPQEGTRIGEQRGDGFSTPGIMENHGRKEVPRKERTSGSTSVLEQWLKS